MKVNVSNRKYTFYSVEGHISIFRGGQPWHTQDEASKALYSIMAELDAARVVLQACRDLGDDAPKEIKAALAQHMRLVDDLEGPSVWASPWEDV